MHFAKGWKVLKRSVHQALRHPEKINMKLIKNENMSKEKSIAETGSVNQNEILTDWIDETSFEEINDESCYDVLSRLCMPDNILSLKSISSA